MTRITTNAADKNQILALNAVRGIAALMVVFSHLHEVGLYFGPAHQGSLGVMVFFTLSGFLMGVLYLHQPTGWLEVSRYAVARFSRIAPPYLIVIVGSFLIFMWIDPNFPYAINTHNLLRHLLFSGNVSVFWSIPPEVQFYALFVVLWWAVQRAINGRTGALIAVAAIAIAVIFLRDTTPGTVVVSKLHYFLMGTLLGGLHPWLRRVPISALALMVLQAGLLGMLGLFLFEVIHLPQNYWHDLAPTLLAGLTVFAFSHDRTLIDSAFAARPFQWLGNWSFSLYLMHVPLIYLMAKLGLMQPGITACVGVTLAVAGCALFSIFIEHPACAFTKRRLGALLPRKLPAASAPSLLVAEMTTDRTLT